MPKVSPQRKLWVTGFTIFERRRRGTEGTKGKSTSYLIA